MREFVRENARSRACAIDGVMTNLAGTYTFVSVCRVSHWFIKSPTSHIRA
jgi:hypothetical protein